MTDTREEYEEWCIETMPRQVAQWEIEHGHNSWQAWQYQQEIIDGLIDSRAQSKSRYAQITEKLQGYIFALESEQAHVEKLQNRQKWVSVEDHLPEHGGRYLCYIKALNSLGFNYYMWNCSFNETEKSFREDSVPSCDQITHWMSLPQPPEDV